jgi:hypothetical protein
VALKIIFIPKYKLIGVDNTVLGPWRLPSYSTLELISMHSIPENLENSKCAAQWWGFNSSMVLGSDVFRILEYLLLCDIKMPLANIEWPHGLTTTNLAHFWTLSIYWYALHVCQIWSTGSWVIVFTDGRTDRRTWRKHKTWLGLKTSNYQL